MCELWNEAVITVVVADLQGLKFLVNDDDKHDYYEHVAFFHEFFFTVGLSSFLKCCFY